MKTKLHFKLHKVKKHWVAIAVVATTLTIGGSALADSTDADVQVSQPQVNLVVDKEASEVVGQSAVTSSVSEEVVSPREVTAEKVPEQSQAVANDTVAPKETEEAEVDLVKEAVTKVDDEIEATKVLEASTVAPTKEDGNTTLFSAEEKEKKIEFRNQFVSDEHGNWYYFGSDGKRVTGRQIIDGQSLYFRPEDGRQIKGQEVSLDGRFHYYEVNDGREVKDQLIQTQSGVRYYGPDGMAAVGWQNVKGDMMYFDPKTGLQVRGGAYRIGDTVRHFNAKGVLSKNSFVELPNQGWIFVNADGIALDGWQVIDGKRYYFRKREPLPLQVKGDFLDREGHTYYFDPENGELWQNRHLEFNGHHFVIDEHGIVRDTHPNGYHNQFVSDSQGNWYYYGVDGAKAVGDRIIDDFHHFFHEDGRQAKGELIKRDGRYYYYDKDTGHQVRNQLILTGDDGYHKEYRYFGPDGVAVTGWWDLENKRYYFDPETAIKHLGPNYSRDIFYTSDLSVDGVHYYLNPDGSLMTNRFIKVIRSWRGGYKALSLGHAYLGSDGREVTGWQTINGRHLYFYADGFQAEAYPDLSSTDNREHANGRFVRFADGIRYFDVNGDAVRNRFVYNDYHQHFHYYRGMVDGYLYFGSDGLAARGLRDIDGHKYFFRDSSGLPIQVKGELVPILDKLYYFDPDNGHMWTNRYLNYKGSSYRIDSQGVAHQLSGPTENDYQVDETSGRIVNRAPGRYQFVASNGQVVTSGQVEVRNDKDWRRYLIGADGYLAVNRLLAVKGNKEVPLNLSDTTQEVLYVDDTGQGYTGRVSYQGHDYYVLEGRLVRNRVFDVEEGRYIYVNAQGQVVKGITVTLPEGSVSERRFDALEYAPFEVGQQVNIDDYGYIIKP